MRDLGVSDDDELTTPLNIPAGVRTNHTQLRENLNRLNVYVEMNRWDMMWFILTILRSRVAYRYSEIIHLG